MVSVPASKFHVLFAALFSLVHHFNLGTYTEMVLINASGVHCNVGY
jgi:hypothetical protein